MRQKTFLFFWILRESLSSSLGKNIYFDCALLVNIFEN